MKNISISLLMAFLSLSTFTGDKNALGANRDNGHPRRSEEGINVPVIREKIEYYDIGGISEKELVCQLREKGCRTKDGGIYDSITHWRITWDYGYDQTSRGCAADDFQASIAITYTFPRWVETDGVAARLMDGWKRYLISLIMHEKGHRDMAVDAVIDLSFDVADLPPFPRCSDLDRAIRSIARDRNEKLNEDSRIYDAATGHGATQGAAFPQPVGLKLR